MRLHSLFYALLGSKNIKVLGKHCVSIRRNAPFTL